MSSYKSKLLVVSLSLIGQKEFRVFMLCTFCGTDNRPENKFCGMCGVRLERRKADRRLNQRDVSLKCTSCGNVNEPGYKFCGICGTRIERRMGERRGAEAVPQRVSAAMPGGAVSAVARRQEAAVATMPGLSRREIPQYMPSSPAPALRTETIREPIRETVREPEVREQVVREQVVREPAREPAISGPSFLGLGSDPGPEGEGDYLLEEEPSSHGGLRAFILLLIVAAIAALIYMQWRSSNSGTPRQPNPQPASVPQPAGKNTAPANGSAPQDAQAAAPGNANPSDQNKAAQDPKASTAATDSALGPSTALAATKDPADSTSEKSLKEDVKASSAPAEADDASDSADDSADPPDTPKASATKASASASKAAKAPESVPRKPSAALLRAQQYLQGRGVPQSCEQGLIYLRAAAQKNEPDAAVQMGALYASGHCVAQDHVMAYRWFNSAHELEPANPWIQKDMSRMLSQMSPQERRQVGY